jgi:hypothetical protein
VYDVVNAHFDDPDYRADVRSGDVITCSSEAMAGIHQNVTGGMRLSFQTPTRTTRSEAAVIGERGSCGSGTRPISRASSRTADLDIDVCTGDWSLRKGRKQHSPRQELFAHREQPRCQCESSRQGITCRPLCCGSGRLPRSRGKSCPSSSGSVMSEEGIRGPLLTERKHVGKCNVGTEYVQDTFQSAVDRVAMGGPIRLDLGAGHKHEDGWVRVDFALDRKKARPKAGLRKRADPSYRMWKRISESCRSPMTTPTKQERFTSSSTSRCGMRPKALKEWVRVLKPGAELGS